MTGTTIRTFLGANSKDGFASLYPTFPEDCSTIVIKGGPGSGKSGVMKKVAAEAVKRGYFVEFCYCSSDAESLDGIRIPKKNLCIVDGTPPHLIEPKFPGAKDEIFNTGLCWNRKKLKASLSEIEDFSKQIKECFARAYRYLSAAGKGVDDIRATILPKTEKERLNTFSKDLLKRYAKKKSGECKFFPRFLSGITPQGYIIHRDTVYALAEKVFVLEDPYRISHLFLESILNSAEELGQPVYVFYNPLCPSEPHHVVLPESGIGFVTSNKLHPFEPQNAYKIHLNRFSSLDESTKLRCKNAEQLISGCLKEAFSSLKQEKAFHDDLEEFYIEAMDFKKLNTYTAKLLKSIF